MPKYIFSQGKILVEEGIYKPLLKRKQPLDDAFVLLLLISKLHAQSSEMPASLEKEQDDVERHRKNR